MYICILDPLEFRNNHKKESMDERSIKGKGMMTSRIHDVIIREQHEKPHARCQEV